MVTERLQLFGRQVPGIFPSKSILFPNTLYQAEMMGIFLSSFLAGFPSDTSSTSISLRDEGAEGPYHLYCSFFGLEGCGSWIWSKWEP